MNPSKLTTVRFSLHSLTFVPFKEDSNTINGVGICRKVIDHLNAELRVGRGIIIDRNRNRKDEDPRNLFALLTSTDVVAKRMKGVIAVLRSGRLPYLKPVEKFSLVPLSISEGDIAEQTHFFIDYSKNQVVVCLEFNNLGPRPSDFEYYMRHVASDVLRVARSTTLGAYMTSSIEETLANLANVLNIDVKLQPKNLNYLDTNLQGYFTAMRSLAKEIEPRYIKMEAMYRTPGGKIIGTPELNKKANIMVTNLLNGIVKRPENLETFDNFTIEYTDKSGEPGFLDLLKGKREFTKEMDLDTVLTPRDWHDVIKPDFDEFIKTL